MSQSRVIVLEEIDTYAETKERLRSIKLSNEYYYYDAVGNDLQNTELDAIQLLSIYLIQRYDSCMVDISSILKHGVRTDYYVKSNRYYVTAYVSRSLFNEKFNSIEVGSSANKPKTLVDSLVSWGNFSELISHLRSLHDVNRVMYGRMDMILDTRTSYIVVFDDIGNIVAFLEPGESERVDLKSSKYVNMDNYANNLKLWLIVY